MEKQGLSKVSEHIFEIRYSPNSKILDLRGLWAELISKHLPLSEWKIIENRIDIFDKDDNNLAFVTYRNAGIKSYNPPTENYFLEKAVKFFKFLSDLEGFDKPLFVERLGVRAKFVSKYDNDFDSLVKLLTTKFINLTMKSKSAINADLINISTSLQLKDKVGNFNVMSGPIKNDQIKAFFNRDESLYPEVGLFYDIDYWSKPNQTMSTVDIIKAINNFYSAILDRHKEMINLVFGE
jgi:hypothetical protein